MNRGQLLTKISYLTVIGVRAFDHASHHPNYCQITIYAHACHLPMQATYIPTYLKMLFVYLSAQVKEPGCVATNWR